MAKLIVLRGLPASGKSTLAEKISKTLGIHWIDVDAVRLIATGMPNPHPKAEDGSLKRDGEEMDISYRMMLAMVDENLKAGRSIIMTATFSRAMAHDQIQYLLTENPGTELNLIWCNPQGITNDELEKRFNREGYLGTTNTVERFRELERDFVPDINHPQFELRTALYPVKQCLAFALAFIRPEE